MLHIPRIVIAATQSGAGKTTIVSGLLSGIGAMGQETQAYKIGPDYIDPGYHQLASGRPGHNLDTWLVPQEKIQEIFTRTAMDADIAIIEGVMGLYDGGRLNVSSTAAIAKLLDAPVLLVIDVKSMGDSAAAIAMGFRDYDPAVNLCGVILNRVGSSTHETMVREAMEKIKMPVLGSIRRDAALRLPERHLGLTPVTENDASEAMEAVREAIATQVDLQGICRLAQSAPPMKFAVQSAAVPAEKKIKIAVAKDEAFSFYYPESLDVLSSMGAQIISFSPLSDATLPKVDGLLIGGGFPEMFAEALAANVSMRESIAAAGSAGMPIYAECGGLMYLTEQIEDFSGRVHAMVGLIPARCTMQDRLQTVGYVEATALRDHLLCAAGETLRGHEFHFSAMRIEEAVETSFPWAYRFEKKRTGARYPAGYASKNILASYLHMHFAGNRKAAQRFVAKCVEYAAH